MQWYCDAFKGKNITLLGLGLLGRGVGDAAFLAACGAKLTVTDKKSAEELRDPVARLKAYPGITFHLGGHRIEDFTGADLVVKAAGVPLDSKEVAAARHAGVPVAMSTALFAKYAAGAGARIVGITGTRGKSTVAHLIFHVLQKTGLRAHLGGNVRGISTLAMLPDVQKGDIVVLELDSWQLQGFGDLRISPHIAVFTNLMPDHQNYYRSMDEYFSDKANIFAYQQHDDVLIVGASIADRIRRMHPPLDPIVPERVPATLSLKIPGEHNRENASLAAAALEALGIEQAAIRDGLRTFDAIEGRLQFVRDVGGVKLYNDNNATTPEATVAALRALAKDGPIVLIAGGSEKGSSLHDLVAEVKRSVAHVVLLMHPQYQGSERLKQALSSASVPCSEAADLQQALHAARRAAQGGSILFSPAFASFGMFKNEYDRNDTYLTLVRALS